MYDVPLGSRKHVDVLVETRWHQNVIYTYVDNISVLFLYHLIGITFDLCKYSVCRSVVCGQAKTTTSWSVPRIKEYKGSIIVNTDTVNPSTLPKPHVKQFIQVILKS